MTFLVVTRPVARAATDRQLPYPLTIEANDGKAAVRHVRFAVE